MTRASRRVALACLAGSIVAACGAPTRPTLHAPSPSSPRVGASPAPTWPSHPRPTPCPDHPSHCLAAQVRVPAGALSPRAAEIAVGARAREVLAALAAADATRLAALAHPGRGVRFSTGTYVQPGSDVRLSPAEMAALAAEDTPRVWGYADGSGRPIRLTFAALLRDYFYDRDYARAPGIAYNRVVHAGNTNVNVFDIYPRAVLAEYHFCVPPGVETLDWRSLRLLFELSGGEYRLVAVVRDQWTI